MMPRQHDTADRRRLAAALRELREATGLSAQRFGEAQGWSQSKVAKIENGRTIPSPEDVETWAAAAGAAAERITQLVTLAESVGTETRRWASSRHETLAERGEKAGLNEARSEVVRVFQPNVIPGMLQTAEYARRVVTMLGVESTEIAGMVNARMQRQDRLYDPSARFEFVLTEGSLRWRPASPSMMAAQLDRLLSVATLETVDVRVLPFTAEAPALYVTGFTIYEIPDDPLILAETTIREIYSRQESDIEKCRAAFTACHDAALAGDDAAEFIRLVRSELPAQ